MIQEYIVGFSVFVILVMSVHPSWLIKILAVAILAIDFAFGGGDVFAWVCVIGAACWAVRVVLFLLTGRLI